MTSAEKNLAATNPIRVAQLQQRSSPACKRPGLISPNPNAGPTARRYDPTNLADQGDSAAPKAADNAAPPAGTRKNGKANKKS